MTTPRCRNRERTVSGLRASLCPTLGIASLELKNVAVVTVNGEAYLTKK